MRSLAKALPVLMLAGLAINGCAATAGDRAQSTTPYRGGTYAEVEAPRVSFRTAPQWIQVPGTTVYMVRHEQRPRFDLFRHGANYYIYDRGTWFRAPDWNARFTRFDERDVPVALMRVPENEWREYPEAWASRSWEERSRYQGAGYERDRQGRYSERMPNPRADFRMAPRWRTVPGTRVSVAQNGNARYDMFRVGSTFYVYNDNGDWYRANRWDGDYRWMDSRDVPREIARVPEREWRNYPAEWANDARSGRRDDRASRDDGRWDDRASRGEDDDRWDDRSYRDDERMSGDHRDRGWRDYRNAPPAPRISMRLAPQWRTVPGTRVAVVANNPHNFDLFRVNNEFWLYADGYWYRANRWNGDFTAVDEARVPREMERVPRSHWRGEPPSWAGGSDRDRDYTRDSRDRQDPYRR